MWSISPSQWHSEWHPRMGFERLSSLRSPAQDWHWRAASSLLSYLFLFLLSSAPTLQTSVQCSYPRGRISVAPSKDCPTFSSNSWARYLCHSPVAFSALFFRALGSGKGPHFSVRLHGLRCFALSVLVCQLSDLFWRLASSVAVSTKTLRKVSWCCFMPSALPRRFSCVGLFVSPRTVAHQAPLSMGFSRHEYWSGLPCPSPEDLPGPGIEPISPVSPALAGGFLPLGHRESSRFVL